MATDLDRFVAEEGRDALIADVRRRIDAEGVTYIYYQFISVTGRIMGKGVPAAHWESMAAKGFQLVYGSTANLFTDRSRLVDAADDRLESIRQVTDQVEDHLLGATHHEGMSHEHDARAPRRHGVAYAR